jgi:hypothetical protein
MATSTARKSKMMTAKSNEETTKSKGLFFAHGDAATRSISSPAF